MNEAAALHCLQSIEFNIGEEHSQDSTYTKHCNKLLLMAVFIIIKLIDVCFIAFGNMSEGSLEYLNFSTEIFF